MPTSEFFSANDLSTEEKMVIERLLGRALHEDEAFDIHTYRAHAAPTGAPREQAARKLGEAVERLAARFEGAEAAEIEQAIDEACGHARHGR